MGLYADYGAAQRIYPKRSYVPDGHGIVWRNRAVLGGEHVVADDDLIPHLRKILVP